MIHRIGNPVAHLERQLCIAEARVETLTRSLDELATRQVEAEQRLGDLAQLHAASVQLYSAVSTEAVRTVIKEIVENLIGSETMAIYGRSATGRLTCLDGIGLNPLEQEPTGLMAELVNRTIQFGVLLRGEYPRAIQPLLVDGCAIGAVVIFALLSQKPKLRPIDSELLKVLGTHGARALYYAELRMSALNG